MKPRFGKKECDATMPWDIEPEYCMWVMNLTSQNIHDKADIATILALYERALADMTADYLRRHKDAVDRLEEIEKLKAQLMFAEKLKPLPEYRIEPLPDTVAGLQKLAAEVNAKLFRLVAGDQSKCVSVGVQSTAR